MSSALGGVERFLAAAGFDRAPWLAVAFACGIAGWFLLPAWQDRAAFGLAGLAAAVFASAAMREEGRYPYLRQAVAAVALALAAGCGTVWMKSAMLGTAPIERPGVAVLHGKVLARVEQPAQQRTRLTVLVRDPFDPARIVRVRVNLAPDRDDPAATEGAMVRLRARLMPPAPPMLPGGYDFARAAWFERLAGTGSALERVTVVAPADGSGDLLDPLRRRLSAHVRANVDGSPGGIAAAFASGDRGGIAAEDEQAMRDSGLTHLLSVSGLHVSAVVGAVFVLLMRVLALSPWLALRIRIPLAAAAGAALAGIFYTLLTGAEVPTVRSALGALLVLVAIAIGREPISLRMLAVAGFAVMLLWPEAVVGPSFQLSFGAVLAIVALHSGAPMRAFLAWREEPWWAALLRRTAGLLLTGVVIELALMPIGLFHFHRAGVYGSLANVVAIPLTTFVTMPLIALALLFDAVGMGTPFWWIVARSLDFLLWLAHLVAAQPSAVTMVPTVGAPAFALFLAGGLWLALWRGRVRLWGLLPVAVAGLWLALLKPADIYVSGDGRHVGITGLAPEGLVLLRETRSDFARENLQESAGMDGPSVPLESVPQARCNADFCALALVRGDRTSQVLLARGTDPVSLRDLAAACERVDYVIADRRLPISCRPRQLKIDRALLDRTGGVALRLDSGRLDTVAENEGDHGWWSPRIRPTRAFPKAPVADRPAPTPSETPPPPPV